MTGVYRQVPASGTGEPCMVIPARYNRETLVYPDPDTILPSNSISDETVEAINRAFWNSETITIRRLKNGDIVITFKEEVTEYKKENDWIIEMFGTRVTYICCEIVVLVKGLSNRDIIRAHTDLERLFEDLKRKNTPNITRIKLRHI